MTGAEDKELAALHLLRPESSSIGERALPEINKAARHRPGGNFEDQRAGFFEVWKRHGIGRRGIGGEQTELVLVVEVIHVIELARAEGFALFALPLGHRDVGQGPEVSLTRALEIEGIVELGDRLIGRVAVLDFERADRGLERARGGQFLREDTYAMECEGGG